MYLSVVFVKDWDFKEELIGGVKYKLTINIHQICRICLIRFINLTKGTE